MAEFKDIVHFYQGCNFVIKDADGNDYIDTLNIVTVYDDGHIEVWGNELECVPLSDIKLILREACYDFMTNKEKEFYSSLCKDIYCNGKISYSHIDTPESLAWLIINKFDVFELKEKGFATYG